MSFTRIPVQSVTLCLCLEDLGSDTLHGLLDWEGFFLDRWVFNYEDREGGGKKSDTQVTLDRCNGCYGSLCCGWHPRQAAACGSHSQITPHFSHTMETVQTLTPKMKVGAEKSIYYLGQIIVTAEKFMRLIYSSIIWYHAISSFGSTSTRPAATARRELALQIEVDVAWYQMIALLINLMNISAVTIFLARVVTGFLEPVNIHTEQPKWRPLYALRHGSMEAILACHPALSAGWLAGWQFCVYYDVRAQQGPIELSKRVCQLTISVLPSHDCVQQKARTCLHAQMRCWNMTY